MPKADRKYRVWTTSEEQISLSSLTQVFTNVGLNFTAKIGRNFLPSDTIAHIWCKGVWTQTTQGDDSREQLAFGIGFWPSLSDAGDFPSVLTHDGDWVLHDSRGFREPSITTQEAMKPIQLATIDIESRGMRSAPKGGADYDLLLVAQSERVPSSGSFELQLSVTCLWLTG